MKKTAIASAVLFGLLALTTCKKKEAGVARVNLAKGQATLVSAGQKTDLKANAALNIGDTIVTGSDGLVIGSLEGGAARFEVQANSSFTIRKVEEKSKVFFLKKGSTWFLANKTSPGEVIKVRTPAAVAAVRGTKFFSFELPDGTRGTCHCEGDVEYSVKTQKYKKVHHKDQIVFHRKGKMVVVQPEELAFMGAASHHHSVIDDSPLGPKNDLSPENMGKMMNLVNTKFKALK